MSPKVEGKKYYKQESPSKRGFKSRGLYIHEEDLKAFEADMKAAGCTSGAAYLRHLWNQDRERRELPPITRNETE